MTRKLLTTLKWIDADNADGALEAKLYRDTDWDEFVVDYYEDGVKVSDSHHERTPQGKKDALGDAHANLEFMAKRRLKRSR